MIVVDGQLEREIEQDGKNADGQQADDPVEHADNHHVDLVDHVEQGAVRP